MEVSRIIAEIDAQILKLQQARCAARGRNATRPHWSWTPQGSTNGSTAAGKRKRKLTPEGRKRIADAMKKRWAERRKQTSGR